MDLPIDVVPGSNPPKFRWRHVTDTMAGKRTVDCNGCLPVSVEAAVAALVAMVKRMEKELAEARARCDSLAERVAAQAELLSKRVEKQPTNSGGRK
jgi:hypothetical protein